VARAILDSPDRAESKVALATVAPPGTGYEHAVTSQTGSAARLARARRTCGIFLKKSFFKVVDDLDPYPTNIPYIVSVSRRPVSPQASVFYYYSLDGDMVISRFLRVHKRPMRMYAKVMGQKIILCTLLRLP
jgi:hypothetical protein